MPPVEIFRIKLRLPHLGKSSQIKVNQASWISQINPAIPAGPAPGQPGSFHFP
jgi:hypothetical protein